MGFTDRDIAEFYCYLVLALPLVPFVLIKRAGEWSWRKVTRQDAKESKKSHQVSRRPLTPLSSKKDGANLQLKTCMQIQSVLFNKAPFEIRQAIYHLVLSFPVHLKLEKWNNRLYTERFDYDAVRAASRLPYYESDQFIDSQNARFQWTILGLLASCRRVYWESIHILYESNILMSQNTLYHHILILPKVTVPARLQTIRHFEVEMGLFNAGSTSDREELTRWKRSCRFLAGMKGLRVLIVRFWAVEHVINPIPYLNAMVDINVPTFRVYVQEGLPLVGFPDHGIFPTGPPFQLIKSWAEFAR